MSFRANKRYGPKPHNYTMMQAFEWYVEGDGKHWKHLKSEIPELDAMGITALWLPPPCKASSKNSVGYDIYDVWDLASTPQRVIASLALTQPRRPSRLRVQGEFDQKSQVGTKYGTKNELLDLIKDAGRHGVVWWVLARGRAMIYLDAVLNHKFGADKTEVFKAVEVARDDRMKELSEPHDITLADIIKARKEFAYGEIRDYWDHPNCIGWVRTGDKDHPNGCAVILCNGTGEGSKWMEVGKEHAGEQWIDLLGWYQGEVTLNDDGWGEFKCHARSIGIWVKRNAVRHQHGH
ncbi:glycoside hydrolase family 13 protein [Tulasnella calospora MUT 4182]|uniref:Glycoside hydrolase family 13 protein n=1 Tax=Tulasnella calospora MUT 4182 TaxID=1051891 RepID=A0A0C3L6D9_9AGAM|nr:glycoside hydrolase family 13 protein [Tulasnella calospora MUT 4182]